MIPQMNKIKVFHNDDFAGTLQMTPDGKGCVFGYAPEWLRNGFSLSPIELPLTSQLLYSEPEKFDGNFALFEDSMPLHCSMTEIRAGTLSLRLVFKSGFLKRDVRKS